MSDINQLGKLFQSRNHLAGLLGLDPSLFVHWNTRNYGRIPYEYNLPIETLAQSWVDQDAWPKKFGTAEEWVSSVQACLTDKPRCPHCHQEVSEDELIKG
jgi:hypothetical protein